MTTTTTTTSTRAIITTAATLAWSFESGLGGEWIRHDLGDGVDAILHGNADGTALTLTISDYADGETLLREDVADLAEAEALIRAWSKDYPTPAAPSTLTIGRTTYTVDSFGPSSDSLDRILGQGYITGPRGGVQNVIIFDNGVVRLVQYSRGAMPRGHRDIYGDEADAIRAALMPTENDESTADAESVSVADLVEEYRATLQTSQNEGDHGQAFEGRFAQIFKAKKGRRYWKITHEDRDGGSLAVHSFIDATTGEVFKADGWSKPAAGARFDLTDPASRDRCMEAARRSRGYTGFLYR